MSDRKVARTQGFFYACQIAAVFLEIFLRSRVNIFKQRETTAVFLSKRLKIFNKMKQLSPAVPATAPRPTGASTGSFAHSSIRAFAPDAAAERSVTLRSSASAHPAAGVVPFAPSRLRAPEPAISRRLPVRPALSVLRDFYLECRRQFRRFEHLQTSVTLAGQVNTLRFQAAGFDLTLTIREGGES